MDALTLIIRSRKSLNLPCTGRRTSARCISPSENWYLQITRLFFFFFKQEFKSVTIYNLCFPSRDQKSSSSHSFLSPPLLPQAPDKHGFTPLMTACFEGHLSCVKLLLEKVGALIAFMYAYAGICTKECTGVFHPLVHADVSVVPCEP